MKTELVLGRAIKRPTNQRQNFIIRQNVSGVDMELQTDLLMPRATTIENFKDLPLEVTFQRVKNRGTKNSRCLVIRGAQSITCLIPNGQIPAAPGVIVSRPLHKFL
jgi:hypothetical protein